MLADLLGNAKTIGMIAAILAAFSSGWYVRGQKAEHDTQAALKQQETALVAKCDADKQITSEVDNAQLQKITALSKQLANTKRMFATKCVPVANPASVNNASAGRAEPIRPHGIAAESLLDLAAEGESYRLTLISCQDYVRKIQ